MPSNLIIKREYSDNTENTSQKMQALIEELEDKETVLHINSKYIMQNYYFVPMSENDPYYFSEFPYLMVPGNFSGIERIEDSFYDYEMEEGRFFTQDELDGGERKIVLLNQNAYNDEGEQLHVGDIYKIKLYDYEVKEIYYNYGDRIECHREIYPKVEDLVEYEFEIIGLFSNQELKEEYRQEDTHNLIYMEVPKQCLDEMKTLQAMELEKHSDSDKRAFEDENGNFFTLHYEIPYVYIAAKGVEASGTLENEIRGNVNFAGGYYSITSSAEDYRYIQAPLENLTALTNVALGASAALTIVLLSLVAVLFLRNRTHEIGILMAMGDRKRNILGQFILEIVVIGLLATGFSLVSGNYLGSIISNEFMKIQIDTDTETEYQKNHPDTLTQLDLLDTYKVEMNVQYIVMIVASSTLILMISSAAPVLYILKIKPKKVLM